jgi:sugar-specific transcriptional regulator TrmB
MEIESTLEQLGLSNQEANVYITSLKLGIAKASHIAQKTGMQRGAVYYTLRLLKEKGFISEVIKSGVQYFSAVSPNRILDIIDEERLRKKEAMNSILSELKDLQETSLEKPIIEIYEGYEGFKTIFSKLLEKPNQEFRAYLSSEILDYLPHFHEQFRTRRAKRKTKIRTITEDTLKLREIKKLDKKELRETRFDKTLLKNSEVLHYILDDAIVVIKANKKEQLAIYIQEKNLANLYKNIFESQWKLAKK